MIDPALKHELNLKEAGATLSVLLEFAFPRDLKPGDFAKISSPQERLSLMDKRFQAVKAPIFEALTRLPDVQLRDLPASGNAVMTTTVNRLRELLGKTGVLGKHDEIKVYPNVEFRTFSHAA